MNFAETENWILRLTSLWADGVDTHATGIFIAGDLDDPGSVYDVVHQSGYDILNLEAELFTNTKKISDLIVAFDAVTGDRFQSPEGLEFQFTVKGVLPESLQPLIQTGLYIRLKDIRGRAQESSVDLDFLPEDPAEVEARQAKFMERLNQVGLLKE